MKRTVLLLFVLAGLTLAACSARPATTQPTALPPTVAPSPTRPPIQAVPVQPTATRAAVAQQPAATPNLVETVEAFDIRSARVLGEGQVRAAAGSAAETLGSLAAGQIVVVTGESDDWYEIVSGLGAGGHAWIPKAAVTFELATATPTATATLTPTATVAAPATPAQAIARPAATRAPALPGRIVFQDAPGGDIYIMNADGSGLRRLTRGMEPALSPDGTQVAFGRWDEPRGLWLINSDGSNERLVFGGNRIRSPSWTPDGQSVVFERNTGSFDCRLTPFGCLGEDVVQQLFGGQPCIDTQFGEICLKDYALVTKWFTALTSYNINSGAERDLPAPEEATAPQMDPAGDQVVFLDPSGWSVTPEGGNGIPWPIVPQRIEVGVPSYSPDGQYLYTSREQHDHWQIWRRRADGSQAVPLTVPDPLGFTTSNNVAPAVSPDGQSVVFLTDRNDRWEMWVMNNDGSNQRPLAPEALSGINLRYDFNSDRAIDWGN